MASGVINLKIYTSIHLQATNWTTELLRYACISR